jgi:UDP-glucose 4-epimerase
MQLRGRKVLVTGGAGFIGSRTVAALVARGARVVIVDNLSTGHAHNLIREAVFYNMSIADEAFDEVLDREQPEIIFHFAFHVLVPQSVENPLLDMESIAGSLRLLRWAARAEVTRIVFASSGFLYGNTLQLPVSEDAPIDPVTPYVVSKHAVENYLHFYHKAFGLPFTILRYAAIYGPGQVTGAMADYIRRLTVGEQAEIWGDGTKTRDYVYIDDVVQANLRALELPAGHVNPVFNIGTGVETTLNTVYAKIARMVGTPARPIYYPDRPGEQLRYSLANRKAKEELGWIPEVDLERGLEATVSAYLRSCDAATRPARH